LWQAIVRRPVIEGILRMRRESEQKQPAETD
jgi:hypothetical protein